MVKYLLTVVALVAMAMAAIVDQSSKSYLRGHTAGFIDGTEAVTKGVQLLIQRPGVKKSYKDGRGTICYK